METGKTGKYFKYAIGEIILVVIGILIALQINNWNEGRKINKQGVAYVNKIINDLKVDTTNINTLITKTEIFRQNIVQYKNYFTASDSLNLNLKQLIDSINRMDLYYVKYFPVNKTFKNMETSGNSELLTDVQRDFLIMLAADQEEVEIINKSYIDLAVAEFQKSKQLLGFPTDFYDKLSVINTEERQVQGLLHLHLYTEALEALYFYIKVRGEKIKNLSVEAIQLLQTQKDD